MPLSQGPAELGFWQTQPGSSSALLWRSACSSTPPTNCVYVHAVCLYLWCVLVYRCVSLCLCAFVCSGIVDLRVSQLNGNLPRAAPHWFSSVTSRARSIEAFHHAPSSSLQLPCSSQHLEFNSWHDVFPKPHQEYPRALSEK